MDCHFLPSASMSLALGCQRLQLFQQLSPRKVLLLELPTLPSTALSIACRSPWSASTCRRLSPHWSHFRPRDRWPCRRRCVCGTGSVAISDCAATDGCAGVGFVARPHHITHVLLLVILGRCDLAAAGLQLVVRTAQTTSCPGRRTHSTRSTH